MYAVSSVEPEVASSLSYALSFEITFDLIDLKSPGCSAFNANLKSFPIAISYFIFISPLKYAFFNN